MWADSTASGKLKAISRKSLAVIPPGYTSGLLVIILSDHSTGETKILGLPNFARYSVRSASVTPLALSLTGPGFGGLVCFALAALLEWLRLYCDKIRRRVPAN